MRVISVGVPNPQGNCLLWSTTDVRAPSIFALKNRKAECNIQIILTSSLKQAFLARWWWRCSPLIPALERGRWQRQVDP